MKSRMVIVDFGVARILNGEDRASFRRHHAKAVPKSQPSQQGMTAWTEMTYKQDGKEIVRRVYVIDSNSDEDACGIALKMNKVNKYAGFG